MTSILWRWMVLTVAVWVSAHVVPGIECTNGKSLLWASLVLGILNSFAKPILVMLSFPFVVVTLGLFLLVINALLLWVTGALVEGFHVAGFWSALGASLLISAVSLLLGGVRRARVRRVVREEPGVQRGRGPPPGKGPIIDV